MKNEKYYANLILIAFAIITLTSCSKKDDETGLEISQEIKNLMYYKGEEDASVVLLNVQGGPGTELSTFEVDLFFQGYFETKGILMANVHQTQTLNPTILSNNDISLNEAVTINSESVSTLYEVIKYFKNQDRKVYILGVSYGAFLTQELIAKYGIDVADKYLIMNGRLDINDIMWQALAEGKEGEFINGVTPIINNNIQTNVIDRNSSKLSAALGMNKYTQLFQNINNLANITYVYGKTDEAVGSLTAQEVSFLESKKATIIAGPGNHTDTYNDYIVQGLDKAFGIVPK
ncbi:MAG: hypothetical protein ACPGU6_02435 [Tenacibaculum sp.]